MPRAARHPRRGRRLPEIVVEEFARIDRDRARRAGVPEVVLREGKTVPHLIGIVRSYLAHGQGALVSRPTADQHRALENARRDGLPIRFLAGGRLVRISGPLGGRYRKGTVGLVSAGTSDV